MERTEAFLQLSHLRQANQRYRFITLLTSLLLLFVAMAVVYLVRDHGKRLLSGLTVALLFDLMLLSAVNAVAQTRKTMVVAISIAVPAALFSVLTILFPSSVMILVINNVLAVIFITLAIVLVLDFLFRTYRVDANMICASLCIYLLIGVGWASLYSLCEVFHRNSFVYVYTEQLEQDSIRMSDELEDKQEAKMVFRGEKSLIPIYYSFVTLTTLGYGDMVPLSPPAKILAILEAVVGQIYLTVLVARLVGLHIAHVTSRRSESPL